MLKFRAQGGRMLTETTQMLEQLLAKLAEPARVEGEVTVPY